MPWGLRRQIFYILILFLVVSALGFVIVYPTVNKAPTCFDKEKNGNETGVDCGGSCALACLAESDPISVLWARAFEVIPGRYSAVAYLVNHNRNKVVKEIKYRFRFADKDNIFVGKREGTTFIPPSGNFAVFEGAIGLGSSMPVYTTFEFTEEPTWIQVPSDKISQLQVTTSNIKLEDEATSPHLSATIRNNSLYFIPEVDIIAILYDALGNAVASSRTYLDKLDGLEVKDINFTWPQPFNMPIVSTELIPIYNIFNVKIK